MIQRVRWWLPASLVLLLACGDGGDDAPSFDGDGAIEEDADASFEEESDTDGGSAGDGGARDARVGDKSDAGRDASASADAQVGRDAAAGRDAGTMSPRDGGDTASGPSSGCGKAAADPQGQFTKKTIRAADMDRTYYVYVPEQYDPTRAYPVVFRFHGTTGNGLSGGLDIEKVAPKDMIVIAPDGQMNTWTWMQKEIALFDGLSAWVGEQYCIDKGKQFVFGFSAGAGVSQLLSCVRGNVLRGLGAIAGYNAYGNRTCQGQVAGWHVHDSTDTAAPIAGGRAARDALLKMNGCSMESEPAGDTCVRYRGCAEGHPVVWCETSGMGHNIRGDYAPGEVWKFFSALP